MFLYIFGLNRIGPFFEGGETLVLETRLLICLQIRSGDNLCLFPGCDAHVFLINGELTGWAQGLYTEMFRRSAEISN